MSSSTLFIILRLVTFSYFIFCVVLEPITVRYFVMVLYISSELTFWISYIFARYALEFCWMLF